MICLRVPLVGAGAEGGACAEAALPSARKIIGNAARLIVTGVMLTRIAKGEIDDARPVCRRRPAAFARSRTCIDAATQRRRRHQSNRRAHQGGGAATLPGAGALSH